MRKFLSIFCLFFFFNVHAQDISLDGTFNVPGNGIAFNASVQKVLVQPDGKILVGGGFTSFNGITRNRILRLNSDGSLDESFNPGVGPNAEVISIAVDNSGRIYIGGGFTLVNGSSRKAIARLNPDGSLDNSFSPSFVTSNTQYAIVRDIVLSDEKVLIAGDFRATTTPQNGVYAVARYNVDGSYDTSFTPSMSSSSTIIKILVQPDDKILIGGSFNFGTTDMGFARLNSDGTKDLAFNSLNTLFGFVYDICLDSDNKILVGGLFSGSFGASQKNILARVNPDGLIDSSFNMFEVASSYTSDNVINAIRFYNDNILVGGQIPFYGNVPAGDLMLINYDGNPVSGFNIGSGFSTATIAYVNTLAVQSDNKIIAGGQFTSFDGSPVYSLARLIPSSLASNDFSSGQAFVYCNNDFLHVYSTDAISSVSLYDLSGRLIVMCSNPVDGMSVAGLNHQLLIVDVLFDDGSIKKIKVLR